MSAIETRRRPRIAAVRLAGLLVLMSGAIPAIILTPAPALAHPLGNFSINQYSGIRIRADHIELRYVIDLAEIPTFQTLQDSGMRPDPGHPTTREYLAKTVQQLKDDLVLEVDGRRLPLQIESNEIIFPPGAGDLPTLKLGVRYRATIPPASGPQQLIYRDGNFPNRAGWKEIVATGEGGITVTSRSVPEKDRSQELADYPTDLLNSPPQDLEARLVFVRDPSLAATGRGQSGGSASEAGAATVRPPASRPDQPALPLTEPPGRRATEETPAEPKAAAPPGTVAAESPADNPSPGLQANRQGTPRSAFTELVATKELSLGVILTALAVSVALGAFHALEPGHGKTVVGAYLVGIPRKRAGCGPPRSDRDGVAHGRRLPPGGGDPLRVPIHHARAPLSVARRDVWPPDCHPGVRPLPASVCRHHVRSRPWALARAWARHHHGQPGPGSHSHESDHTHDDHSHHHHDHDHHHDPGPGDAVALPGLVALGVSGGIVPCPAAVVVLLSALALNRVGFGLLLIVAFSIGLAAVLIAIGILMVYAGRFMARFHGEGPLIQRWLPLASSVVITVLGVGIAIQALDDRRDSSSPLLMRPRVDPPASGGLDADHRRVLRGRWRHP